MHIAAPEGLTTVEVNELFRALGGTAEGVCRFLAEKKEEEKTAKKEKEVAMRAFTELWAIDGGLL
jgi:hypothetical protein